MGNYFITGKVSKHKQQIWADKTAQSIGRPIGFVFQDSIITAPRVNASIKSGMFQLTFAPGHAKKICTLYQHLRKEKIDSINALFELTASPFYAQQPDDEWKETPNRITLSASLLTHGGEPGYDVTVSYTRFLIK